MLIELPTKGGKCYLDHLEITAVLPSQVSEGMSDVYMHGPCDVITVDLPSSVVAQYIEYAQEVELAEDAGEDDDHST